MQFKFACLAFAASVAAVSHPNVQFDVIEVRQISSLLGSLTLSSIVGGLTSDTSSFGAAATTASSDACIPDASERAIITGIPLPQEDLVLAIYSFDITATNICDIAAYTFPASLSVSAYFSSLNAYVSSHASFYSSFGTACPSIATAVSSELQMVSSCAAYDSTRFPSLTATKNYAAHPTGFVAAAGLVAGAVGAIIAL
jgi:hypothetical protein